jgi:hypothetical protein
MKYTDTNGHTNRGDERESRSHEQLLQHGNRAGQCTIDFGGSRIVSVSVDRGGLGEYGAVAEGGDPSTQGNTFEQLVEDNDDGEGDVEGVACNNCGYTDYWS